MALCDPSVEGLEITEIMPYPQGGHIEQQWVELTNVGAQPVPLGRMVLSVGKPPSLRQHSLPDLGVLAPGQIMVFGGGLPTEAPIDVTLDGLHMPHEAGVVALHCQNERLAGVVYGSSDAHVHTTCEALGPPRDGSPSAALLLCQSAPRARAGVSLSLDRERADRRVWDHSSGSPYDGHNTGTPQRANLGAMVCQDEDGQWRRAKVPEPGQVRIVAVYADPPGPDDGHEWLVLRAVGPAPLDLAGLSLLAVSADHKPRRWHLDPAACWSMAPGQERLVRVLTSKAPKALVRAALEAGDPVLWGPALPNVSMRLSVTFDFGAQTSVAQPPCDVLVVAKARCGTPFVRDADVDAPPLWPSLAAWHAPAWP